MSSNEKNNGYRILPYRERERLERGGNFVMIIIPLGYSTTTWYNNNNGQEGGKEKKNYHRIRINRYDKLLVVSTMSAVLLLVPCSVITTVMDGEGAPLSRKNISLQQK